MSIGTMKQEKDVLKCVTNYLYSSSKAQCSCCATHNPCLAMVLSIFNFSFFSVIVF